MLQKRNEPRCLDCKGKIVSTSIFMGKAHGQPRKWTISSTRKEKNVPRRIRSLVSKTGSIAHQPQLPTSPIQRPSRPNLFGPPSSEYTAVPAQQLENVSAQIRVSLRPKRTFVTQGSGKGFNTKGMPFRVSHECDQCH